MRLRSFVLFFFFNDTATTEIYTLSLHDALPIYHQREPDGRPERVAPADPVPEREHVRGIDPANMFPDRKSTRLNSSHLVISYAVFCLKKKKRQKALHTVI